jgi:hypothetical protein
MQCGSFFESVATIVLNHLGSNQSEERISLGQRKEDTFTTRWRDGRPQEPGRRDTEQRRRNGNVRLEFGPPRCHRHAPRHRQVRWCTSSSVLRTPGRSGGRYFEAEIQPALSRCSSSAAFGVPLFQSVARISRHQFPCRPSPGDNSSWHLCREADLGTHIYWRCA